MLDPVSRHVLEAVMMLVCYMTFVPTFFQPYRDAELLLKSILTQENPPKPLLHLATCLGHQSCLGKRATCDLSIIDNITNA